MPLNVPVERGRTEFDIAAEGATTVFGNRDYVVLVSAWAAGPTSLASLTKPNLA